MIQSPSSEKFVERKQQYQSTKMPKVAEAAGTIQTLSSESENKSLPLGWTTLHSSVNYGSLAGVQEILRRGADANARVKDKNWTPLWLAACRGYLTISKSLLEAGADPNIQTNQGVTPLKEAAQIGASELVKLLIGYGASVDLAPYEVKDGPLIAASARNHLFTVDILLKAGADPNIQTKSGWSPLHYAIHNGNEEMAALIIKHSPNPNLETLNGIRPLHFAAQRGLATICMDLIAIGAERDATEEHNLTALRLAVAENRLQIVEILIASGADPNITADGEPNSLQELALILGHIEIHNYLKGVGSA